VVKRTGEDRIWTLANIITMSRMVGTLPLFYYLVTHQWRVAFWVFFVVAITDKLDGLAARLFSERTALGARLDPMVDYFMLGFITLGVLWTGPWWFRGVVVAASIRLLVMSRLVAQRRARGLPDLDVNHDGKVAMVAICFSLASFMLYQGGADRLFLGMGIGFIIVWAYFGLTSWRDYRAATGG